MMSNVYFVFGIHSGILLQSECNV